MIILEKLKIIDSMYEGLDSAIEGYGFQNVDIFKAGVKQIIEQAIKEENK